jgi:hypothetical protein
MDTKKVKQQTKFSSPVAGFGIRDGKRSGIRDKHPRIRNAAPETVPLKDKMTVQVGEGHECAVVEAMKMQIKPLF